jgi:2-keto-4-pentenoate hydratase
MPSHQDLAARLRDAYASGAVPPLRDGLAPDDAAGAYAVQALNTAYWQAQGRKLSGRKIGLTAKAVQMQLGVNQPDFGALFADMAIENGGTLNPAHTLQPKVEAEVALVLAKPLNNPNATIEDIITATAYAVPALEIVDSRIADWKITFADTVADNGSSAYYVIGNEAKRLDGLDLYTCGMAMTVNGQIVSLGAGAACLGHPLNAALWLVQTLAGFGDGLQAGDVILTGALGPMVALKPGDVVEAQVGGLGRCGFQMGAGA